MSEQLVIWRFNVIPTFEAHYQSNTCDSLATVRGKLKIVDGLAFVAFERPPLKSGYAVLPESHNAHVWRQVGCGWIKLCIFVPGSFLVRSWPPLTCLEVTVRNGLMQHTWSCQAKMRGITRSWWDERRRRRQGRSMTQGFRQVQYGFSLFHNC